MKGGGGWNQPQTLRRGEDIIGAGEILFPLLVVLNMEKNVQAERRREHTPLRGGGVDWPRPRCPGHEPTSGGEDGMFGSSKGGKGPTAEKRGGPNPSPQSLDRDSSTMLWGGRRIEWFDLKKNQLVRDLSSWHRRLKKKGRAYPPPPGIVVHGVTLSTHSEVNGEPLCTLRPMGAAFPAPLPPYSESDRTDPLFLHRQPKGLKR